MTIAGIWMRESNTKLKWGWNTVKKDAMRYEFEIRYV
jgi:hypothetical protein